jgi:hypothetical protein
MPEFDATIVDSTAAEIIYISGAAFVAHSVPLEEPTIGKPLPLYMQLVLQ